MQSNYKLSSDESKKSGLKKTEPGDPKKNDPSVSSSVTSKVKSPLTIKVSAPSSSVSSMSNSDSSSPSQISTASNPSTPSVSQLSVLASPSVIKVPAHTDTTLHKSNASQAGHDAQREEVYKPLSMKSAKNLLNKLVMFTTSFVIEKEKEAANDKSTPYAPAGKVITHFNMKLGVFDIYANLKDEKVIKTIALIRDIERADVVQDISGMQLQELNRKILGSNDDQILIKDCNYLKAFMGFCQEPMEGVVDQYINHYIKEKYRENIRNLFANAFAVCSVALASEAILAARAAKDAEEKKLDPKKITAYDANLTLGVANGAMLEQIKYLVQKKAESGKKTAHAEQMIDDSWLIQSEINLIQRELLSNQLKEFKEKIKKLEKTQGVDPREVEALREKLKKAEEELSKFSKVQEEFNQFKEVQAKKDKELIAAKEQVTALEAKQVQQTEENVRLRDLNKELSEQNNRLVKDYEKVLQKTKELELSLKKLQSSMAVSHSSVGAQTDQVSYRNMETQTELEYRAIDTQTEPETPTEEKSSLAAVPVPSISASSLLSAQTIVAVTQPLNGANSNPSESIARVGAENKDHLAEERGPSEAASENRIVPQNKTTSPWWYFLGGIGAAFTATFAVSATTFGAAKLFLDVALLGVALSTAAGIGLFSGGTAIIGIALLYAGYKLIKHCLGAPQEQSELTQAQLPAASSR